MVASPFVELRRILFENEDVCVDLAIGWSYLESDHATGERTVANLSVMERETNSRYTYVYDFPNGGSVPAGFPPIFDNTSSNGVIYNAASYNAFSGGSPGDSIYVRNPRTFGSSGTSERLFLPIEAVSSADLDLHANVIPILVDARFDLNPDMVLGIGAGPTLNVISHELTSQTEWLYHGRTIASQSAVDRGTDVAVGATVRATVSIDLNEDGSLSLEIGGGYDWVPSQTVTAGPATAEIDLSSWFGSIGLCKVF